MSPLIRDLFIAFRNVTRQRRRSAVGIAAVAFGVIALLEAGGFIEWAMTGMREGTIHSRLGHLQIVRQGYYESGFADPFEYLLPDNSPVFEKLQGMPGVVVITPRLNFTGLVSIGDTTVSFIGEGMDPLKEEALNRSTLITAGKAMSSDDPAGVVVGEGLAANLGVKVGDRIVLLANTGHGGINGSEGTVRGFFSTATKAYDDAALRLPLPMAQKLLRVSGSHVWAILLNETSATQSQAAAMAPLLAPQKLQLVPWYELADFYNKTAALFAKQVAFMKLIIGLIIVMCISNTLTMSVMERTAEIGTAMALGIKRRNILQQFIAEGLVIGVIGCVVGVIGGIALAKLISAIGIPMSPPPGLTRKLVGEILLTPQIVADAAVLAIVTSTLAAIYPAFKGARMIIVDALRFSR